MLVTLMLGCVANALGQGAETGQTELAELVQCMQSRLDTQARSLDVKIVDEGSQKNNSVQFFARLDVGAQEAGRSLRFHLTGPADVVGTSYLLRHIGERRDIHVYLPALGRSQRIEAHSKVRLLGTAFELSQLASLLGGFADVAMAGGRTVLEQEESLRKVFISGKTAVGGLQGLHLWINTRSCQPRRLSLNDGSVIEISYLSDQAMWPSEIEITNPAQRRSSSMTVTQVRPLSSADVFTVEGFYQP